MGRLADFILGKKHYYTDSFFGNFETRYRLSSFSTKRVWVANYNKLPEYKDVAVYVNGDNLRPSQSLLREVKRIFSEMSAVKAQANSYFLESTEDDYTRDFIGIRDWQDEFVLKSIENHGENEYLLEFVRVGDESAMLGFTWSKKGVSSGYCSLEK